MIKVIIFDLGDVIFNIDWFKINEEMIKKFDINTLVKSSGNEELIKYYYETLEGKRDIKDYFNKLNTKNHNLKEVMNYYKELYKKYKKLNKELIKLIKKLREKIKVACLTDTNSLHFEAHKEQGFLENFDYVFASFKLGSIKSDKNTFIKVINILKVKPKEIVFIDDNEKNIKIAKSLRIKAIKYENLEQLEKDLSKFISLE